jgi:hypothetical protein
MRPIGAGRRGRSPLGAVAAPGFDEDDRTRRCAVKAAEGDKLVVKGHHVGEPDRDAEVLEVRGTDGGPPYLVRWSDDGHEGLYFPGSDALAVHYEHGS